MKFQFLFNRLVAIPLVPLQSLHRSCHYPHHYWECFPRLPVSHSTSPCLVDSTLGFDVSGFRRSV